MHSVTPSSLMVTIYVLISLCALEFQTNSELAAEVQVLNWDCWLPA